MVVFDFVQATHGAMILTAGSRRSHLVMVALGATIHELACNDSISPTETHGWSDQVRP
jgi:hypothetical protein